MHSGAPSARARRRRRPAAVMIAPTSTCRGGGRPRAKIMDAAPASAHPHGLLLASQAPGEAARLPGLARLFATPGGERAPQIHSTRWPAESSVAQIAR